MTAITRQRNILKALKHKKEKTINYLEKKVPNYSARVLRLKRLRIDIIIKQRDRNSTHTQFYNPQTPKGGFWARTIQWLRGAVFQNLPAKDKRKEKQR